MPFLHLTDLLAAGAIAESHDLSDVAPVANHPYPGGMSGSAEPNPTRRPPTAKSHSSQTNNIKGALHPKHFYFFF